jgi:hypothetical protein
VAKVLENVSENLRNTFRTPRNGSDGAALNAGHARNSAERAFSVLFCKWVSIWLLIARRLLIEHGLPAVTYNFCRIHQTLRVTPAMDAGVSDHVWNIDELIALV